MLYDLYIKKDIAGNPVDVLIVEAGTVFEFGAGIVADSVLSLDHLSLLNYTNLPGFETQYRMLNKSPKDDHLDDYIKADSLTKKIATGVRFIESLEYQEWPKRHLPLFPEG